MNNDNLTIGRVYSTTVNHPSGIIEVLLERAEKERNFYKQALAEIAYSINEWTESMVKEPAEDLIAAVANKINNTLIK